MQALLRTIHIETAAPAQRAGRVAARSRSAALNEYEQWSFAHDAAIADARSYPAPMHSSLMAGNLPVSVLTRAPGLFHSLRVVGANRSHAHSLRNKPCFQHRAYALHFHNCRLSSSPSSDGQRTIGKALADGRISFGGHRNVFPR